MVFPAPGEPPADPAPAFKGLAIAQVDSNDATSWRLFATNFSQGRVDVFDGSFPAGRRSGLSWTRRFPKATSPFGIQAIGSTIYVTYALRNPDTGDDVAGPGHGFVNAFDLSGQLGRRASRRGGPLNSPWGLAWASDQFRQSSVVSCSSATSATGASTRSHCSRTGRYETQRAAASRSSGPPLHGIEGLWAIQFGKGGSTVTRSQLFFTAGPDDENGGLFGFLTAAGSPGHNKD